METLKTDNDSYGTLHGSLKTTKNDRMYIESREVDTSYKQTLSRGRGVVDNRRVPLIGRRNLAPDVIGKDRAPHLSPIGSLTNLLTDISSAGGANYK